MTIVIKPMETEEEIRGKAYVAWRSWHEAYAGLVRQDYLDRLTLEKLEQAAFAMTENFLVAKEADRVVGFIGWGMARDVPEAGEIICLYVLAEYYGKGVGRRLMKEALGRLRDCPQVRLWVLKENARAIRFYEKCGFSPTGEELYSDRHGAYEIRMARPNAQPAAEGRQALTR